MTKAVEYPIPTTRLDKEVARLALADARKLVARGHAPEGAARLACKGAWGESRGWVLARLRAGEGEEA